jgi:hypothetical protein
MSASVVQIPGDKLAFEYKSGDEEEDRQQAVGRPCRRGQVQVQRFGPERERAQ